MGLHLRVEWTLNEIVIRRNSLTVFVSGNSMEYLMRNRPFLFVLRNLIKGFLFIRDLKQRNFALRLKLFINF